MTDVTRQPFIRRFAWLWVLILIATSAVLRFHNVEQYHYSSDETNILDIAKGATFDEVLHFASYETHPPLFYVLLHFWLMLSINTSFVRALSLLFGLALIPLYYAIGRKLNGELTGLFAALLIAFSPGCIIQSFVVRQYSCFLFLLSLAFYAYLQWRENKTSISLCCYVTFAALACLTHFSGIFAIFCIAAYECLRMMRCKVSASNRMCWIAANIVVAAVAAGIFYLWLPILQLWKPAFGTLPSMPLYVKLSYMALYPLAALNYILPNFGLNYGMTLVFFVLPLMTALLPKDFSYNKIGLHSLLWLAAGALALGMFLAITNIYNIFGTRRGLWILPLLLPCTAWVVAELCRWLGHTLNKKHSSALQGTMFAVTFAVACVITNAQWQDSPLAAGELLLHSHPWQQTVSYIASLDEKTLIVSARAEAFLFAPDDRNLYRDIGNRSLTGETAVIPYYHTHALFYFFYDVASEALIELFNKNHDNPSLIQADSLAFVVTNVNAKGTEDMVIVNLMDCKQLEKKLLFFPARTQDAPATREDILRADVTIMILPKRRFYDQVLAVGGKAHSCLQ